MVMTVLDADVPDGMDCALKFTLVSAGLPEAENEVTVCVGPPVVFRSIVKVALVPAATVTVVGGAATTLKSTPRPLKAVA